MKKNLLLLAVCVVIASITFYPTQIQTHPTTPQNGHTGAPGDASCGKSSCHNTAANTGSGSVAITFSGTGDTYSIGDTLDVTVTVTDATKVRSGFQMINFNSGSVCQGSYINSTTPLITQTTTAGSKTYIEHKNIPSATGSAGVTSWTFKWIAPTTNAGDITFYAGAIAANNNNSDSGDLCYQTSKTLSFFSGLNDVLSSDLVHVGPNPAKDYLYITTQKNIEHVSIFDIKGNLVKENLTLTSNSLDISDLNAGMYMIVFHTAEGNIIHKILK